MATMAPSLIGPLRVHTVGPPIPKSELYGLFSPFKRFRVGGPPDQGSGNLGLGLYIVRSIVDQLGGAVHVDSRPGAGATFVVELPLQVTH